LMCGRSLTFREDALVDLGATPQIRGAAPVEMFRWGIAATAHQAAEPLTFPGSGVREMMNRLQNKKRPLPLGEGWGEGLASTETTPTFFFSFSLSCAPSPWPSPKGRGKAARRYFVGALFMALCLFSGASAVFAQT